MSYSRPRSVSSVIGPPHLQPGTMRRLLRSGFGGSGAAGHVGAEAEGTQHVLAVMRELPIPDPWNLDDFVSALGRQRRRPIRLQPYPADIEVDHPCGLLLRCDDEDVIFYENSTSQYHCQQIILHEIGHIVLRHQTPSDEGPDIKSVAHLLPDIDIDAMTHVLGRTTFDNDQEYQAEMFASLLLSQQCTTLRGSEPLRVRGAAPGAGRRPKRQ